MAAFLKRPLPSAKLKCLEVGLLKKVITESFSVRISEQKVYLLFLINNQAVINVYN